MISTIRMWEGEYEGNKAGTWLPKSCAGGQGLYSRSLDHLGRSSEAKDCKNPKKVKCDGPTDGRTDRQTDGPTDRRTNGLTDKAGCRVA